MSASKGTAIPAPVTPAKVSDRKPEGGNGPDGGGCQCAPVYTPATAVNNLKPH